MQKNKHLRLQKRETRAIGYAEQNKAKLSQTMRRLWPVRVKNESPHLKISNQFESRLAHKFRRLIGFRFAFRLSPCTFFIHSTKMLGLFHLC